MSDTTDSTSASAPTPTPAEADASTSTSDAPSTTTSESKMEATSTSTSETAPLLNEAEKSDEMTTAEAAPTSPAKAPTSPSKAPAALAEPIILDPERVKSESTSQSNDTKPTENTSTSTSTSTSIPSDDTLRERLRTLLTTIDLDTTTSKMIRTQLEKEYGCDLMPKKKFLNDTLMELIQEKKKKDSKTTPKKESKDKDTKKSSSTKKTTPKKESKEKEDEDVEMEKEDPDREMAERLAKELTPSGRPRRAAASEAFDKTAKSVAKREKEAAKREQKKRKKEEGEEDEDAPAKKKKPPKHRWLSPQLAEFMGVDRALRGDIVKRIWEYVKANDLQDPKDKRKIRCDEKLNTVFKAKTVNMFKMNQVLSKHIYEVAPEFGAEESEEEEEED